MFGLKELRSSRSGSHKRNASSLSGLGGGGRGADDFSSLLSTSRTRSSKGALALRARLSSLVKWVVVSFALVIVVFWFKYELHIELQLYSRGWVRDTILPVVDPSPSHCFSRDHIASTEYNVSLADGAKRVEVHSGIAMPLGNDCYDFAQTIPREVDAALAQAIPTETIVHLYWRDDLLPLGPRQVALIESILYSQDERSTRIVFWTNAATTDAVESLEILEPILARHGPRRGDARFEVKRVDKRELARATPMRDHKWLDLADEQAWVDGDLVRVLVLYAYGGVWIDFDTILTGKRDLRVLLEHEWVTQWDCYDKIYQPLNGAMMHFFKHSPYLCEMLSVMSTSPAPAQNSVDWGARLYHKVWRSLVHRGIKPFKVLPYCFTDGVSCRLDNRLPDPFDKDVNERRFGGGAQRGHAAGGGGGKEPTTTTTRWQELENKLDHVWAVHLHNRWDKAFPRGGYVDEMILKPLAEAKTRRLATRLVDEI